jgi:signal transduction histidine kinase
MKIRTQSRISGILFGVSLFVVIVTVIWTTRKVYHAEEQEEIARRIVQMAEELIYLAEDYMMYRESRQLDRWKTRFARLSAEVGRLQPHGRVQQWITRNIKSDENWLKEVFDSWDRVCRNRSQGDHQIPDPRFLQVSWSRMNIQGRALTADASRLLRALDTETNRAKRTRLLVIYAVAILFGVQILIYFIVHRRLLDSIRRLHTGTGIIGSGDFDYSVQEKRKDEIGDLSRAFNSMAIKLKTVTAKKTDLERQIIERRLAEEALQRSNRTLKAQAKQLQALSVELREAEEQERRRVAELLHGDLQQMLAAARLQLDQACRKLPSSPILMDVLQMLEASIEKTRRLAYELSPPVLDQLGLAAALEWLARQMIEQFGLQVYLDCDGSRRLEHSRQEVFIFHTAQELLLNTVKHAETKSAHVAFSAADGCFTLTVSDRGKGFNPAVLDSAKRSPNAFGLLSIRERAAYNGGRFEIESAPGRGSRFTLRIPSGTIKPEEEKNAP